MLCFLLVNFPKGGLISKCRKKGCFLRITQTYSQKKVHLSSFCSTNFCYTFRLFFPLSFTLKSTTSNRNIKVNTLFKLRQKCYLRVKNEDEDEQDSNNIIFPYFNALCASYISFKVAFFFCHNIFNFFVAVEMYTIRIMALLQNRHHPHLYWLEHFLFLKRCNIFRCHHQSWFFSSISIEVWLFISGKFVIMLSVDINAIYSKVLLMHSNSVYFFIFTVS